MAEQITHKKSLKRVDNEKRRLLKEYYRLQKDNKPGETTAETDKADTKPSSPSVLPGVTTGSIPASAADIDSCVTHANLDNAVASTPQNTEQQIRLELEKGDIDVTKKSLKQLLQVQNLLLAEETEADNTIKNTIYDNYYDLIKVDETLKEMTQLDESLVEKLRETCNMARSMLKQ
ncbi:Vps51 [Kluyveromyces lactis]|nr:Vps51 [Kluyveromyces lactis]